MGSTESVPIARKDSTHSSLSTPPNYDENLGDFWAAVKRASKINANLPDGERRSYPDLPGLEYGNENIHSRRRNEFDNCSQGHQSDGSVSNNINVEGTGYRSTTQHKKFRMLRKRATRSNFIDALLNNGENYELKHTNKLSSINSTKSSDSLKTQRLYDSNEDVNFRTTQKRKSSSVFSQIIISSPSEISEETQPKKIKKSSKSSHMHINKEIYSKESKSAAKSSKVRTQLNDATINQPQTEKSGLHHILFMADQSRLKNPATKTTIDVTKSAAKVDPFNDVSPDLEGPPRTQDQNSARVHSPHIHDVLLGRGNGVSHFPGNLVFRDFCWSVRKDYNKAIRNEKGRVAAQVIDLVKQRKPPGRFLELADGYYTEVPYDRVKEKIQQG
jgi:hypothetical protein